MGKINIKDLEVYAYHGVMPEEKTLGQKFLISITMHTDLSKAARTSDLAQTINYAEACEFVNEFTKKNTFDLIESLADSVARILLNRFELASRVDVQVKKPWAPIGLPLDSVSVEVSRSKHRVYIALGSNMGDKETYLREAVESLNNLDDFNVTKVSDFIITPPYGGIEQDDFLNGVLEGETTLNPYELLDIFNEIESQAGRTRDIHWGPRTLDLDIIFYDDLIIDSESLTIPHKEMHLRDFVLEPMNQIASWVRHPITGKTVEEMVKEGK